LSNAVLHRTLCFLFAAVFLLTGKIGSAQEAEEGKQLQEQQRVLTKKVDALRKEQDFLLFEKTMYGADSKYLVIHGAAKKGQLKYRNRILMDFRFSAPGRRLKQGMVSVTRKIEGPRERNALIFGKSFIMEGRRPPSSQFDPDVPHLSLSKKDFLSIYYAVEKGAMAYILP